MRYSLFGTVFFISLLLGGHKLFAQNIAINTSGAANSTLSMLEILQISSVANTKGLHITHSGGVAGIGYGLWVEVTGATTKYAIVVPSGSGNVGIGTITPQQNLSVGNGMNIDQAGTNAGTLTNGLTFGSASGEGMASKRTATGNQFGLDFYTAFVNRMSIATGGYVGVNTSSPQGRLDVYTGATATDALYVRTDPGANPWQGGIIHHQSTTYGFKETVQNTSSATLGTLQFDYVNRLTPTTVQKSNILVLEADGNVGIGTLAPSSLLHLQSANTLDVPRGDIILSRYWASNADTRASSIFHYYNSATGNDNLAFGVAGGGGTIGQPNALSQIKMIIQGSGNVGIGTTAPGSLLEIKGPGSVQGNNPAMLLLTSTTNVPGIVLNSSVAGSVRSIISLQKQGVSDFSISNWNGAHKFVVWDDVSGLQEISIYSSKTTIGDPGGSTPQSKFNVVGSAGIGSTYYASAAPANGLLVEGNVAIGTTTPDNVWGSKMEVYNGNIFAKNAATGFYTGLLGASGSSTGIVFRKDGLRHAGFKWDGTYLNLYNASGDCCNSDSWTGTGVMTWDINTGYVGISKSAPAYPLTIGTTGNSFAVENTAAFVAKNAGGAYETYFWPRWSDNIMYMNYGSAGYQIRTNSSSNVMFMDNSAQVGVGRTNPDAQLHVNATFKVGDLGVGSRQVLEVVAASGDVAIGSQTQDADVYIRNQAGTNIMHFGANSSSWINGSWLGIGCTNPQYPLHVVGNLGVVGTIYATAASVSAGVVACSDIRYKKNISTLTNSLYKILDLRGVNYFWKANEFPDKHFSNDQQIGFIAQELEKIYPELVVTDKDGFKSVDYSRLTPALVEAIKQQQELIKQLRFDVNGLKTENQNLKNDFELRIKQLELQQGAKAEK